MVDYDVYLQFLADPGELSEEAKIQIAATLRNAGLVQDRTKLEPGDLFTTDSMPGIYMYYCHHEYNGNLFYIIFSFYKKAIFYADARELKDSVEKVGHIKPDSIFKEDINYGVQEN